MVKDNNNNKTKKELHGEKSPDAFNDKQKEIREGAYCTQCGKHMKEGEYSSRDGNVTYYFFHLFKRYVWLHYFCSDKCDKKFWRSKK